MTTQSKWQLLIDIIKKLHNERLQKIILEKENKELQSELAQRNAQLTELAKRLQVLCNEKDEFEKALAQETGAEK